MTTTRRGLFQMFAAAFAAAGVPLRVEETQRPAIQPVEKPKTQPSECRIEIREVREVWFDGGVQDIEVTSYGDEYRRFELVRAYEPLISMECEPMPEIRHLVIGHPEPQHFMVRIPGDGEFRGGELRFSGWLRSMEPKCLALGRATFALTFQIQAASFNSLPLM